MLVHLAAVDLEAFAELDIRSGDDLLEQRFAVCQRWHEKKSKRATIRQTCGTSATTRSMTDFQCGGSAWRHY
jgi:hypothetical protein